MQPTPKLQSFAGVHSDADNIKIKNAILREIETQIMAGYLDPADVPEEVIALQRELGTRESF